MIARTSERNVANYPEIRAQKDQENDMAQNYCMETFRVGDHDRYKVRITAFSDDCHEAQAPICVVKLSFCTKLPMVATEDRGDPVLKISGVWIQ